MSSSTKSPSKAASKTPSKSPSKSASKKPAGKKPKAATENKKRRVRRGINFSTYVHKLIKSNDEHLGVTKKAMAVLNSMIADLFTNMATEAGKLVRSNKRSTMTDRDIVAVARLLLPGEVKDHAVSAASKALAMYASKVEAHKKGEKMSRSLAAGVVFPVGRIVTALKKGGFSPRVSVRAAVAIAAALEYLTLEVVETASNHTRGGERNVVTKVEDYKHRRLTPRHIFLAIHGDDELNTLLGQAMITSGGAQLFIQPALLPKKKEVKPKAEKKPKQSGKAPRKAASKKAEAKEIGHVATEVARIEDAIVHGAGEKKHKRKAASHKRKPASKKAKKAHSKKA